MIGIFDSGLGGLTVMQALIGRLPDYDYLYLGDNARAPYGNKSAAAIFAYTRQAVGFLFARGCKLVILACNTASAEALRRIQQEYLPQAHPDKRVLGVVIPICEAAVASSRFGRIGVIGTRATINSGVYERELLKLRPGLEIYSEPAPLLVPLVEEGWAGKPETNMILKKYLRPLKQKRVDCLILGCTHYPFLSDAIHRIMGKNCRVLDTSGIVAEKLADYLARHTEIEQRLGRSGQRQYLTTDEPDRFRNFGQKFIGQNIKEVKRIELS